MSAVLDHSLSVLHESGYGTRLAPVEGDVVHFEGDSLLGFVACFTETASLISTWESLEADFLSKNSVQLRADPVKAWNVYSVLLSSGAATETETAELRRMEEDFRSTRKIARADVQSRYDIQRALAPLLPFEEGALPVASDPSRRLEELLSPRERELLVRMEGSEGVEDIVLWILAGEEGE